MSMIAIWVLAILGAAAVSLWVKRNSIEDASDVLVMSLVFVSRNVIWFSLAVLVLAFGIGMSNTELMVAGIALVIYSFYSS